MSDEFTIFEGESQEKAVEEGLKALGYSISEVEVRLIEKGSTSFLGIVTKPYKVGIRLKKTDQGPVPIHRAGVVRDPSLPEKAVAESAAEPEKDGTQVGPVPSASSLSSERRVNSVDASYKIVLLEEGLFIVVTPHEGLGKPLKPEKIVEDLKKAGLKTIDTEAIKNSCKPASGGTPVRLCNAAAVPSNFRLSLDASPKIVIDKARMSATVVVDPPFNGGNDVTFAQLEKALAASGVKVPVIKEAAARIVRDRIYNEPVMIASGVKPMPGEDGYIKWYFETHAQKIEIVIDESGAVDYHKVLKINTVNEGELICERVDPRPGADGYNVLYEPIKAKPPKEVKPIAGKNTVFTEDGRCLKSTMNGQLIIKERTASVMPIYEVKGDVDFNVGNIDFNGSVFIHGTILDGFTVKAEGNIEVKKTVNAAVIEAKGNVILQGGFIGKETGLIRAGGKIGAKFIQGGNVVADDEIIVENAIMHSNVISGKQIIVKGKKASIIGGRLFASEYVEALTIGAPAGTKTFIEVGVDIIKEQEVARLDSEIAQTNDYLKKISTSVLTLAQMKTKNPEKFSAAQDEILKRSMATRESLQAKLGEIEEQKQSLLNEIINSQKGRVVAQNAFYSGVTVVIRKHFKYDVRDMIRCSALGIENGEVRILPI